jgi:SAM-dependent methyltransferase
LSEYIDNWCSVAAGWERRRDLLWDSTRTVSERLVELLDPRPGQTILDLAAGTGDTGFLALPRLRPGGRLISTDVAPEMVAVARRRAEELGLDDVSFAVEDASAITLGDASVDGVLFRWGLMLVPDMGAAARELARVLRPGSRAAIAVWADPERNEWMTAVGRSGVELGLVERPDPEAPGPFRLAADGRLTALLTGAGLEVEHLEDLPMTWRAPSLGDWWGVVSDLSPALTALLGQLTTDDLTALRAGAVRRLEGYVQEDGSLAVPSLARVALALRPA